MGGVVARRQFALEMDLGSYFKRVFCSFLLLSADGPRNVIGYFWRLPMSKRILIDVEQSNNICVIRFKGRFDTGTDPEYLRAKSDEIKNGHTGKVLADLTEVPYIGSTGVGFIVDIFVSVRRKPGGRFVLVGLKRLTLQVFDVMHLNTVIPLAADVGSGMAYLCSAPEP
jgi:anti-anti-sigma factor